MEILYENLLEIDVRQVIMWVIGGVLIYLAIKQDLEPTLLLPIGFGTLLVNIPNADVVAEKIVDGVAHKGSLLTLFDFGIATESVSYTHLDVYKRQPYRFCARAVRHRGGNYPLQSVVY